MVKLFVYGTLKEYGDRGIYFKNYRTCVHSGRIDNSLLLDLGAFPGLILNKPGYTSFGEIHTYSEDKLLYDFDYIEGYDQNDPHKSMYIRKSIDVFNISQNNVEMAYVYVYNGTQQNRKIIKNGVW